MRKPLSSPRFVAALLACSAFVVAGASSAFALPDSASSPSASAVARVDAVPVAASVLVSAADTSRAAQLLGISPPRQVSFVPACYYVYRYAYVCSGGRCVYAYRYVYVCN
jgi:hypothetical protein